VASLQKAFDRADPMSYLASQHQIFAGAAKTLRSVYVRQHFCTELQEQQFLLEPLQPDFLHRTVSLEEMKDFKELLETVANLLQHHQSAPNIDRLVLKQLAADCNALAAGLIRNWNAAWAQDESASSQAGIAPMPKSQARVQLPPLDRTPPGLVDKLKEIVNEIEHATDRANRFASRYKARRLLLEQLRADDYQNYANIRELAQLVPHLFRRASTVTSKRYSEDLLDQATQHLFITAPAGYGKTSFCKWNSLNDVDRLIDETSHVLPIYVPLHQFANATLDNCDEAFFGSSEVRDLVISSADKGRMIRLYLDGLDEVPTTSQRDKLMNLALEASKEYPSIQIVVTGRTHVFGDKLKWLTRLLLSELNAVQLEKLINNWLSPQPEVLNAFQAQLAKTPSLKPLMRTPLLGTLIIAVYKRMNSLPDSKVRLYETFVELMCGGWDKAKNVMRDGRYGSQAKLRVLTRLAGILHVNERREAFDADQRSAVQQVMGSFVNETPALFNEMLEDGLIVKVGNSSVAFAHLSFQEYLAASELMDPQGQRSLQALKQYLRGDDWWREPVCFLVSMLQRPSETEAWIRRTSEEHKDPAADLEQRYDLLLQTLQDSWPGWSPKTQSPSFYKTTPKTQASSQERARGKRKVH
jgi:hypothetical protein